VFGVRGSGFGVRGSEASRATPSVQGGFNYTGIREASQYLFAEVRASHASGILAANLSREAQAATDYRRAFRFASREAL